MKHIELVLPSNKKFGLFFTFIFLSLSLYFFLAEDFFYGLVLTIFGVLVFLMATFKPKTLAPFNKFWMMLGIFLGKVISPIIMGIVFFGIFTPISIIMQLIKRDELRLRTRKNDTYWVIRNPNDISSGLFRNQF